MHWQTELERGEASTVYIGSSNGGRELAVKAVSSRDTAAEIAALDALDGHPHLVRFFGHERQRQRSLLLLERCECTLKDEVERDAMPISAVEACRQLCSAVAHMHALEWSHGALQPGHVLVRGRALKLGSLGHARRVRHDDPYQPLEARDGRGTDLFALGAVMEFVLGGGGVSSVGPTGRDLVQRLQVAEHAKRVPAEECLRHPLFWPGLTMGPERCFRAWIRTKMPKLVRNWCLPMPSCCHCHC